MEEQFSPREYTNLKRLRKMRLLVIHPEDEDLIVLLAHLKRIGCETDAVWPAPESLPQGLDVVLFLVSRLDDKKTFAWMIDNDSIARIAVIAYETPEVLATIERLHVHGILSKPVRNFGVLAALTTAIGVSRHEMRLKNRIKSLDETLRSRRKIEKAVTILAESKGISEDAAYKRLRDKAMKMNSTISVIAEAIIATNDI